MNVVLALAFAVAAQAAPSSTAAPAASTHAPPTPTSTYTQKPVVFDFTADVIEASPHGPNDSEFTKKRDVKFKNLIQIRRSFEKELLSSADLVGK